jgi:signal transduction histidine kinase
MKRDPEQSERHIILGLALLMSVFFLGLASYLWRSGQIASLRTAVITMIVLLLALLGYLRGILVFRYVFLMLLVASNGLLHSEPFLTERFSLGVFMPVVVASLIASPGWMFGSAIVTYGLLLFRAGFTGTYTEPGNMLLWALIIGGMTLARQVTDLAKARAEEQSRLLAEERALLERRVEERTHALAEANAELRRANELKDLFLASVSHELRTPLNVILGSVELLRESIYGQLNDRQHKALATVTESGQHLLHLINDILDLAKLEAGAFEIDKNKVLVRELCEQCARLITTQAERRGIRFELKLDPRASCILGDGQRLRQVLLNLLSNAVKFTPNGGSIGLDVQLVDEGRTAEFVVWDTGIGIDAELLPQLFQPFVQLDRRLARQFDGTGLGLALAAQLVARHNGTIGVTSEPGRGSRFWVRLPADCENGAAAQGAHGAYPAKK